MNKILLWVSTLTLSIVTFFSSMATTNFFSSVDREINTELINKKETFNSNQKLNSEPSNIVENWYKFLATNDWKVFINRTTWVGYFLKWTGDALIGKMSSKELIQKFYSEIRSWENYGNRNFSNSEYQKLANYTYEHAADISKLMFSKDDINRIMFKTNSDSEWVGVFDASVYN